VNTPVIEVRLWDKRAGAIALDPRTGYFAFGYEPAWLRTGIPLAPIMMPASANQSVFVFPSLAEDTFHRLPGMLADALPDAFGNALIDAWMARRGIARDSVSVLDRLAYMGKRGMGALEFHPMLGTATESSEPLEMQTLVEEARRLMEGSLDPDTEAESALRGIIRVGTSAGGARAKAVIAWNPQTNQVRSGQFAAALGYEHWLLKFDGVGLNGMGQDMALGTTQDYGRIEYAYHLMALAAGIEMYPSRLLEENDRAHFMTRRFDRDVVNGKTVKHHVQTLCAMQHMDYKLLGTHAYTQLFLTAVQLELGDHALEQIFRRMAFNVMARNCDDHTKNFSFILRSGQRWQLSPAYDLTHAHSPASYWTKQHCLSVNGKFDDIRREDLVLEGSRFSIPRMDSLLAEVRSAINSWGEFAAEAALPALSADKVAADFRLL
jgi:serine/threonine-protein kinase HipA